MKLYITTEDNGALVGDTEGLWRYNGLDCCLTYEILDVIEPQLNEITEKTYTFEKSLQAPILEMMLRGVLVDNNHRQNVIAELEEASAFLKSSLQEILLEGLGYQLSFEKVPHYTQLQDLFYGYLGLPPVRNRGQITTNRAALEKLRGNFHVATIVNHLIALRETRKSLGFLYTGIDSDGRIRTSFNIAGTDTGRLNSYASAFGSGTNLQNVTERMRRVFVADPGKKLAYIDLEQAEARAVGAILWNLFHDGKYLDFCESGDLHTNVARMTFKHLPWTDDPKMNKIVASAPFYREDSYRQGCKKLGHAKNYHGGNAEVARQTRVPFPLVCDFEREYFGAFPAIPEWHKWTARKLIKDGWITSMMGRQRWFFGRRWENEIVNAAVAFDPQSSIADYLNRGMLNLWKADIPTLDILLQEHDALLIQYDEEREAEIIPKVQKFLELRVPLFYNRDLIIPTEAQVGWNWSHARNEKKEVVNPDGLEPFTGQDKRKRSAPIALMDRRIPRLHI